MATLRYDEVNGACLANSAGAVNYSKTKPALSFPYDRLKYNLQGNCRVLFGLEISLTSAQCKECEEYVESTVVAADQPGAESLSDIQTRLCTSIDRRAGEIRQMHITSIPGQDATYQAKLAEANDYIAAGSPSNASSYPYINEEATRKGKTPAEIANLYITTNNNWKSINAPVEGIRTSSKDKVTAATTAADAQAAHDDAITALNQYA